MRKLLFAFIESNEIASYESLGFKIEVDDAVNRIFSAEMDLSDYDSLALLAMMEDCEREGLSPALDFNGQLYDFEEGMQLADKTAAKELSVN